MPAILVREGKVPGGGERLGDRIISHEVSTSRVWLFATVHIPKNCAIAEYAGERITRTEAMRRMRRPGVKRISELDADLYVDGSVDGNDTKYINHSCEPNADVFIIDGFMIIFALQEIVPGEEITVDYLNSFEEDRTVCQCRTASCRRSLNQQAA